jgi:hypothetical protein
MDENPKLLCRFSWFTSSQLFKIHNAVYRPLSIVF